MKLYIYETCPYCIKVRNTLKELGYKEGKDIILLDANKEENANELIELGGKLQVPFLIDGETMMYESSDIMEYLREKKNEN
ncbi:TPA: glutathione S-transferase N-terminal domain-containing protein [archaeon]|jgi:glutathione S-transferase|uniref:Glutathione S-transferase N-terminal domain-containing protein n=1 Tax=Candidatus Undinarchaeum marinum TaxID=2756141 RepID=A0A832X504_9ARCH|nr:glutathione S-transferase N-terminal domain-containing protein [Candidatus Undinarchaeum marinum]